jgi:hypothetical protein
LQQAASSFGPRLLLSRAGFFLILKDHQPSKRCDRFLFYDDHISHMCDVITCLGWRWRSTDHQAGASVGNRIRQAAQLALHRNFEVLPQPTAEFGMS